MPKYRDDLPQWVLDVALGYVRGYEDLKAWRTAQRQNILLGRGDQSEVRSRSSQAGRPVEARAENLLRLDQSGNGLRLVAIEQALLTVGADIADVTEREKLRQALLLNCQSGRQYPYEHLDLPCVARCDFYRRRRRFLSDVAVQAGLAPTVVEEKAGEGGG